MPERMPLRFFRLLSATPPARPRSATPPASAGTLAFSATFTTVERPFSAVARLPCADLRFWAALPLLRGLGLDLARVDALVLRPEPEAFRLVARGLLERPLPEREAEDLAFEPLEFERFEPVARLDPEGLDRARLLVWAMLFLLSSQKFLKSSSDPGFTRQPAR